MIKIATLLILLLSVTMCFSQSVKKNGQLSVNGTQLVNEQGKAVVLRGVSFGWHNWWPRFYNEETVNWLVDDWNCTILRAAMGVEPKKAYLSKPKFALKKMEAVIDAAIEKDIYVIIDWHAHELNTEAAKIFFAQMAQKYGSNPHVIYEIFNEPVHDSWEEVKAYSIEVIDAIREYDSNNVILVGNPHWDQDVHLVADNPIEGKSNIMYTLHYYASTHKEYLRERGDYAINKGIPIFISECAGMKADGDSELDYDEWQKWIDWAEERKISWITWSIADKDETCSMLYKKASSKGNWKDEHIKESGLRTKEYLLKYNK
ncbi:MAG: glycoside hydrolase family 5 protein [Prolixibacteraceae bacterium]|nr:glycoside hydrolase family 5 protein [Prolixibacteraceae bacterium]